MRGTRSTERQTTSVSVCSDVPPSLSVLIPAYNDERSIGRVLRQVLAISLRVGRRLTNGRKEEEDLEVGFGVVEAA